jgi:hypothetical protein
MKSIPEKVMSEPADEPNFRQRLLTMQIIVAALVLGVLFFMGIAIFARATGNAPPAADDTLLVASLAFAVPAALLHVVLPGRIVAAARHQLARQLGKPPSGLLNLYQSQMIVGAALLEAPIFFFLIVYMLQGQLVSLAAAVVFLAGLALQFPTAGKLQRWLMQQQGRVEDERLAGGGVTG